MGTWGPRALPWPRRRLNVAPSNNPLHPFGRFSVQTQNPMVVHVYHPYRQPDGVNHCAAVNGHCSHLCLPAPQINGKSPKISCACPNGLMLMSDGLMCAEEGKREPRRGRAYRPPSPPGDAPHAVWSFYFFPPNSFYYYYFLLCIYECIFFTFFF